MATTTSGTSYQVQISLDPADGGVLNFGSAQGLTDAMILQLVAAINSVPWPGGAKPAMGMKLSSTATSFTPDFMQTPAAFT